MDPVRFSATEILKMAIRIEENGEKFYTDAAKGAETAKVRELFEFLAEEEKNHSKFFRELKKTADAEDDTHYGPFDPYIEEASRYINAFADSHVFASSDYGDDDGVIARIADNELEAVQFAIDMEKESLLFYHELVRAMREKDKDTLDEIINEEKKHLMKLTEIRQEIS